MADATQVTFEDAIRRAQASREIARKVGEDLAAEVTTRTAESAPTSPPR